jgi:hypothetical protein
MRRVPSQKTSTTATVAMIWIRLILVISNHVPSKRIASGKNSKIDGAWNPLSSDSAAVAIRVAASVDSAGSSFGATR